MFICVYVYVYIYMYICIYVYIYIYIYIYIYMCVCVCVCVYVHIHMHTYVLAMCSIYDCYFILLRYLTFVLFGTVLEQGRINPWLGPRLLATLGNPYQQSSPVS